MDASVDTSVRIRRALLVDLQQQLFSPANALVTYCELLIEQADENGLSEMQPDLGKISKAAQSLVELLNLLLDEKQAEERFHFEDLNQAKRKLRHDLRTPINAIKGYGEMLLEDIEELSLEQMKNDFSRLLKEADTLLAMIDTIVVFSSEGSVEAGKVAEQSMSRLIGDIKHVEASTLKNKSGNKFTKSPQN